jgi:GH24 family phage-related lysozyme (muramidase)
VLFFAKVLDPTTYLPRLKVFEGVFSYMYVDTTGNVTVGVGNLLANAEAAQQLAFLRRADAAPASADEILADFKSVTDQPSGKVANYYKEFTRLDLPESVIDALLESQVQEFTSSLCAAFPDYNSYPPEACAAIFDMAYNLGLTKLKSEFPHFCKAVSARDWATAAAQCARNGIGADRNSWTKAQFQAIAR